MASDKTRALVGVGMPGSGKTMIFNAVVDQLTSDATVPVTVGAVYLSHKNPALHDAVSILAVLVRNLVEKTQDDLGLGEELSKRKNASSAGLQCGFTASELLQWVRRLLMRSPRLASTSFYGFWANFRHPAGSRSFSPPEPRSPWT